VSVVVVPLSSAVVIHGQSPVFGSGDGCCGSQHLPLHMQGAGLQFVGRPLAPEQMWHCARTHIDMLALSASTAIARTGGIENNA
jgi:hypothetical protein